MAYNISYTRLNGERVNVDDYCFTDFAPYEEFFAAVERGECEKTAECWIEFINARRANYVLNAEFILEDILDAEEVG
jgi:hypothetical protein